MKLVSEEASEHNQSGRNNKITVGSSVGKKCFQLMYLRRKNNNKLHSLAASKYIICYIRLYTGYSFYVGFIHGLNF